MAENLDDLALYVRETLPQPRAIANLRPMPEARAVCFGWKDREFVVKPSFQVFELRRGELLITGASLLMQMAFLRRTRQEKVISAIMENLRQAEELINHPLNRERGLALLESTKEVLYKLVSSTRKTSRALITA